MTNKTRKWIRGGIEILIHGGTSALIAAITTWLSEHNGDLVYFRKAFWVSLIFQFMGNGGLRFIQWWNNNPLPPEEETGFTDSTGASMYPQPMISMNPLSKVQPAPKQEEIPTIK